MFVDNSVLLTKASVSSRLGTAYRFCLGHSTAKLLRQAVLAIRYSEARQYATLSAINLPGSVRQVSARALGDRQHIAASVAGTTLRRVRMRRSVRASWKTVSRYGLVEYLGDVNCEPG